MGIFSSVLKAEPKGNYSYVRPGRYFARVVAAKQIKSPKDGSEMFALEIVPLAVLRTDPEISPSPVGTATSHVVKQNMYFGSTLKSMFMAILSLTEEEAADPKTD